MGRYIRPEVTSSRRGGVRERVTLVAGQYRGEEWQLEEPILLDSIVQRGQDNAEFKG